MNVAKVADRRRLNGAAAGSAVPTFHRGDHVELAHRLIERLRVDAPLVFTDGKFYRYAEQRGLFEILETARLSQILQSFAGASVATQKKPLTLRSSDVTGAIQLASHQVADGDFFATAAVGVVFEDCFVQVTPEKIVQHEHSAQHRARSAYAFGFRSAPAPERLLRFLADVFRDDADALEKISLLQEFLGTSLLGCATKFQRAVVLVGDGANGKSVLTAVAERCMPPGSTSAIPPQDVGQEYRRAQLAGKLLNVVSELPEADIMDSESWKAVVSGDSMTGREIRQAPFTFRPVAGHLYAANRLPGTTDQTHGFWRRLLVVQFNRVFVQAEQNANLADEILAEETPAIVSWMLIGAQRALSRGSYTVPSSATRVVDRWRAHADQVRAFVDATTERLPPGVPAAEGIAAEQLYRSYRYWAQENGHRSVASNSFGERMRLLGLESRSDGRVRRYPVRLACEGFDHAD